jgi:polyhydroxyalkanoate synthase subunit PhaC
VPLAPSPKDVVFRDAGASVYRFRRPPWGRDGGAETPAGEPAAMPLLLVPSLINRWYVLDLRPRASLVESLAAAGIDVFCLD